MKKKIFQENLKIIVNKKICKSYFRLILQSSRIAAIAQPGQFIEIRVLDKVEPLLRRPFSIHRVSGKKIEILYEVVGKGTKILSERKVGAYLDVIGPLGNGFDNAQRTLDGSLSMLVAGGIGVAPLVFLAERLVKSKIIALIGAKTKQDILCEKEFIKLGCSVKIATDDGSRGFKGKVTALLKKQLSVIDYQLPITIYACGPRPMLKEIWRFSKEYKIPAQISLEEHMACGIGACLGCVVKTKLGYKRVCKEGPVFWADEIIF